MSGPVVVLCDGEPAGADEAKVRLDSPLWRLGQSLFETMLVRSGGRSGLFREAEHVSRLTGAARALAWEGCPQGSLLVEWVRRGAEAFRRGTSEAPAEGRLRLTVAWTRGAGDPQTFVTVSPYRRPERPAEVITSAVRVPWGGGTLVPKSANRAAYALAEAQAEAAGADEALLLDEHGSPVEGAKSNLFAIQGRALVTAPLAAGVLAGITRAAVLEIARRLGMSVEEAVLPHAELAGADALFLTNALWGVRRVSRLDGRTCETQNEWVTKIAAAYERAAGSC